MRLSIASLLAVLVALSGAEPSSHPNDQQPASDLSANQPSLDLLRQLLKAVRDVSGDVTLIRTDVKELKERVQLVEQSQTRGETRLDSIERSSKQHWYGLKTIGLRQMKAENLLAKCDVTAVQSQVDNGLKKIEISVNESTAMHARCDVRPLQETVVAGLSRLEVAANESQKLQAKCDVTGVEKKVDRGLKQLEASVNESKVMHAWCDVRPLQKIVAAGLSRLEVAANESQTQQTTYERRSGDRQNKIENEHKAYEQKTEARVARQEADLQKIEPRFLKLENGQKRSEDKTTLQNDRFLKLENGLSKIQNKVEPLVLFSAETSSVEVYVCCPSGYKLLSCSCVGTPYCRGAYSNSDGRCYAFPNSRAASAGAAIRARATCGAASTVGDLNYASTYTGGGYVTKPSVSCPTGYTMIDCSINTRYGEKYTEIPLGIISGGRCMSSFTCSDDSKCLACAICQKL